MDGIIDDPVVLGVPEVPGVPEVLVREVPKVLVPEVPKVLVREVLEVCCCRRCRGAVPRAVACGAASQSPNRKINQSIDKSTNQQINR